MEEKAFARSSEEGPHRWFEKLVGQWQGVARTWTRPGGDADDVSDIDGIIHPLLDGRFLLHEYDTTIFGEPVQGMALYGYDLQTDRFQSVWMDPWHNGTRMLFSESVKTDEGQFSVLGHYPVEGSEAWGWRTEIELTDENHLVITAYNVAPTGEEAKAVEIAYNRAGDRSRERSQRMYVRYESEPVAGREFEFTLVGAQPPAELVYYVGNRPYGEETCEEIPCELALLVPTETAGEFLRLVIQDTVGSEEYRLRIEEVAEPAP